MTVRLAVPPRSRAAPLWDRTLLRKRAQQVLRAMGHAAAELSVTLAKDAEMAALNEAWRQRPRPTDVLSFSLLEGEHTPFRGNLLGEVVIGLWVAERQARAARRCLDDELARLLIHGVLHLLGHDHVRSQDAKRMRCEERRLWGLVKAP